MRSQSKRVSGLFDTITQTTDEKWRLSFDTPAQNQSASMTALAPGIQSVAKKSEREAKEGTIASYIHSGGRIGALVELASETDFVSRGEDFQKLAQEIAMQVAAMNPASVDELLAQPYIRDASKTIKDLVTNVAATTKENVHVRRIQRFALGES